MFNLKLAWRNLNKRKFYTILNVAGLGMAMACCLLIYLYTNYHLSFDTYHQSASATYRLVNELHLEKTEYDKGASVIMLRTLQAEIPQVAKTALAINAPGFTIGVDNEAKYRFKEDKGIVFTNSSWFKLFNYHLSQGSIAQLDDINTALLSEKYAQKYFGDQNVIGKTLQIEDQQVKIVGVVSDKPSHTDFRYHIYLSLSSIKNLDPTFNDKVFTDWSYLNSTNNAFVTLKDPAQKAKVEHELMLMAKKHMGDEITKYYTFKLLPLKEIHFDTRYGGTIQKPLLIILSVIGALIIVIAGINYINLLIAQQARRSVEIGTRKVLGGSSKQLFMQFMTETLLTSVMAIVLAGLLVLSMLPLLNQFLFAEYPLEIISISQMIAFLGILLLVITLASGLYPAILLSRVKLMAALKNSSGTWRAGFGRKSMIVAQNVVAQLLIICTIIIVMQVKFLKNTDMGFNREAVISIPVENATDLQKKLFRQKLQAVPQIQSVSYYFRSPSSYSQRGGTFQYSDRPNWEKFPALYAMGDTAYCRTFGIQIISGKSIRQNAVVPEYLINEAMANRLNPANKEDVIGKDLLVGDVNGDKKGVIVGIVKDFNATSLKTSILPAVLFPEPKLEMNVALKLSGKQTADVLKNVQTYFTQAFPDKVFTYQFLDEQIARLYQGEILQQKLIWIASGVAIGISSLGLLGLISLVTLQRTKEIGIRKVLGATVNQLVIMLSRDFVLLIILALIIASPLAYFSMHKWLQSYNYRIEISWWMFALAGSLTIIIALITVSFQAIKAALANPVESLRNE